MKKKAMGAPVEPLDARAKRLIRLAPRARRVVGKDWCFDNRVECGYLGETLVSLTNSFENQDHVLDFIEAATPEAVRALALKALAFDAMLNEPSVSPGNMSMETRAAVEAAKEKDT